MAATREYELVLMLDPGQDAPARDAVANEAKQQIEADGTLKDENVWGLRKLAYEIAQRTEADYRWFRFEAQPLLLEQLDHNLKIADGVLRFRIFKVDADTPVVIPPATSAPGPGASRERPPEAAVPAEAETATVDAEAATATAVAEPPTETAAEPATEATEPEAAAPEPAAEATETAEIAAEPETADTPAEDGEGESGESAA